MRVGHRDVCEPLGDRQLLCQLAELSGFNGAQRGQRLDLQSPAEGSQPPIGTGVSGAGKSEQPRGSGQLLLAQLAFGDDLLRPAGQLGPQDFPKPNGPRPSL
ncbi:hypothetical protein ACIODT_32125 [Streptomyces sp. NPDC088251]|uniref:hypothetical protein n=1 Tax=Streptomyces sp. NPDC088251 TaxID=3365844 RepID=UPI0038057890